MSNREAETSKPTGQEEGPAEGEVKNTRGGGVKKVVMFMASMNLLLLAYVIYTTGAMAVSMATDASATEAVSETELAEAEVTAEDEVAPRSTGGGGRSVGRVGGLRRASGLFRPQGDISDIFCRPFPEETEQQWKARVPQSCQS
jgi:hypothetical protein